ncbi:MAG: metallophosphoesterase family protein [Thermomicrobiales bacterium]
MPDVALGIIVALFADVHGAAGTLARALACCRAAGVETIALLGDLVDRAEQADACALALAPWPVVGVYGNHERELALAATASRIAVRAETARLLGSLREQVVVDGVCLLHEAPAWGQVDPHARMLSGAANYNSDLPWLTFAGHTHYRAARDERGPLDPGRGPLALDPARRYLINPGALAAGQYAIWDRRAGTVQFQQV